MPKYATIRFVPAIRLLEQALPADFTLERRGSEELPVTIEIHSAHMGPIVARLVTSPEGPVPDGGVRIVVLDGARGQRHERLRRAGQSFVDLAGVVHLRAPGLYVDRMGLEPAMEEVRVPGIDPYSDRASRVVRVLLMQSRRRRWTTGGLAEAADVDVSTASRVVRELRRRELALDEAPGQGRASRIGLADPEALLRDWTRRYSWDDNRRLRVAAPVGSAPRFVTRMGDLFPGRRWALSLHAGASLVAPYAEWDLVHAYLDGPVEEVALEHGWAPSPSGRLVLLEPVYSNSVWFQEERRGGANVVGTVQLVLDLWNYPVRGREQAEHLVETVLRPLWGRDVEH